jgi:hypothetical protein
MIKDELDCSDEEKRIKALVRRIEAMRIELIEIGGKKEK